MESATWYAERADELIRAALNADEEPAMERAIKAQVAQVCMMLAEYNTPAGY